MIAAFGFERHPVAERRRERFRMSPGTDDCGIGRQIAGVGLDRGEAPAVEAKPAGSCPDKLAAGLKKMLEKAFDERNAFLWLRIHFVNFEGLRGEPRWQALAAKLARSAPIRRPAPVSASGSGRPLSRG